MLRRKWIDSRLLAAVVLAILPLHAWSAGPDQDIVVQVEKHGQDVAVDVDCPVNAPRSVVWEVLTDYDHMAQFISNLEYSVVEVRAGEVLRVHQKGRAALGPLTLAFDTVREVELVPYREIRSRLISGDLKVSAFVTRIVEVGATVHVVNSGHYTPNTWIPPFLGPAVIRVELRKQFGEIRTEIRRRTAVYQAAR